MPPNPASCTEDLTTSVSVTVWTVSPLPYFHFLTHTLSNVFPLVYPRRVELEVSPRKQTVRCNILLSKVGKLGIDEIDFNTDDTFLKEAPAQLTLKKVNWTINLKKG